MNGYQITFFTELDKRHNGKQLTDWLIELALELKLPGATKFAAIESFGQDRRIHSVHFIELADQPIQVQIIVTAEDADRLFARLNSEEIQVFYVKIPVEFGRVGKTNI